MLDSKTTSELEKAAEALCAKTAELTAALAKQDLSRMTGKERSQWLTLAGKAFSLIERMRRAEERRAALEAKRAKTAAPTDRVVAKPEKIQPPAPPTKPVKPNCPRGPSAKSGKYLFDPPRERLLPARLESLCAEAAAG
jgi:hypothetical protein